ncbi:MAG: diheme cytochrome c [Betaproteobacteria bacterium]|nr:diheme cytochrome c [Betaproteobacteria bacterium]
MTRKILQMAVLIGSVTATGWLLADSHKHGESKSLPQVSNAKWAAECSSCHTLYHPGLLPERSWSKIMSGLDRHFGENAGLDPLAQKEIAEFLVANSADHAQNRRSAKIAQSTPAQSTPLRISETPWFVRKHDEVRNDVWKRPKIGSPANCTACHNGADKGDFAEARIKIPR